MGFFSSLFASDVAKKTTIQDELNILDAINAHVRWKVRLEKYLNGTSEEKLDPKVICRDDQCILGKWIHGPAEKHFHADDESLTHLREQHAKFHVSASQIVENVQANKIAEARATLEGDYKYASRKVVYSLSELSKHLQLESK